MSTRSRAKTTTRTAQKQVTRSVAKRKKEDEDVFDFPLPPIEEDTDRDPFEFRWSDFEEVEMRYKKRERSNNVGEDNTNDKASTIKEGDAVDKTKKPESKQRATTTTTTTATRTKEAQKKSPKRTPKQSPKATLFFNTVATPKKSKRGHEQQKAQSQDNIVSTSSTTSTAEVIEPSATAFASEGTLTTQIEAIIEAEAASNDANDPDFEDIIIADNKPDPAVASQEVPSREDTIVQERPSRPPVLEPYDHSSEGMQWEEFPEFLDDEEEDLLHPKPPSQSQTTRTFYSSNSHESEGDNILSFKFEDFYSVYCNL